jgi:hypothetical protein
VAAGEVLYCAPHHHKTGQQTTTGQCNYIYKIIHVSNSYYIALLRLQYSAAAGHSRHRAYPFASAVQHNAGPATQPAGPRNGSRCGGDSQQQQQQHDRWQRQSLCSRSRSWRCWPAHEAPWLANRAGVKPQLRHTRSWRSRVPRGLAPHLATPSAGCWTSRCSTCLPGCLSLTTTISCC